MKIPHPALMRMYGTSEVFFKKASAGPRVADEIGRLFAGELLEKLAKGVAPLPLKIPGRPALAAAPKPAPHLGPALAAPKPSPGIGPAAAAPGGPAALPAAVGRISGAKETPGVLAKALGAPASVFGGSPGQLGGARANPAVLGGPGRPAQGAALAAPNPANFAKGAPGLAPNAPAAKPAPAAAPGEAAPADGAPAKSNFSWNKTLAVGGMLGAGALGLGALKAGLGFLGGHGPSAPASYGYAPGGYAVPMGVNGYGAPQPGSSLM